MEILIALAVLTGMLFALRRQRRREAEDFTLLIDRTIRQSDEDPNRFEVDCEIHIDGNVK